MFWRSSLLDETVEWLRSHAYHAERPRSCWTSSRTRPGLPSSSATNRLPRPP